MADTIKPINVEEIMGQIRAEIESKGYNDSLLSFQDVDGSSILREMQNAEEFDIGEMEREVELANHRVKIAWYHQVEGNPLAVFVKKVIRKLTRFFVIPIVEEQNLFNHSTVRTLNQILAYVKQQEIVIGELQSKLDQIQKEKNRGT